MFVQEYREHWQKLADSLAYEVSYETVSKAEADQLSAPKPTVEALDEFEHSFKIALPLSYRAYCLVFGAGVLAGYFRISVPLRARTSTTVDLNVLNATSPRGDMCGTEFSPSEVERIQRMIFFCKTISGEFIGWDPKEIGSNLDGEYAIYWIPRGSPPLDIAHTYQEFVSECCMGSRMEDLFGPYDPDRQSTFAPYTAEEL